MKVIKNEKTVFDKVFDVHEASLLDEEILPHVSSYFELIKEIVQEHKVYGDLENVAFNAAIFLIACQLSRGDNYGTPEFNLLSNLENLSLEETLFIYHYLFKNNKWAPKPHAKEYNNEYYYYNVDLPHEIILASTVENIIDKTISVIANHQMEILKLILKANLKHPMWYTIRGANTSEDVEEERNRISSILC